MWSCRCTEGIPSQCEMRGSVLAQKAAPMGRTEATSTGVSFTKSDAASLVRRIGIDVSAILWTHPGYHDKHWYDIDRKMEFTAPRIL